MSRCLHPDDDDPTNYVWGAVAAVEAPSGGHTAGECGDHWQWRDLNLGTAVAPGLRWRQCQCDISPVTLSAHHSVTSVT